MAKHAVAGLLLALSLTACKYSVPTLPGSGGKTCEVIVVTPKSHWDGYVGQSIRAFLGNTQPGLNQPEPYFDLVNILPRQFNESEMFKHHRNVVIVEFEADRKPAFELVQDAWAYPQVVAKFTVPDERTFDSLFDLKKEILMAALYTKEYQRVQKVFKAGHAVNVSDRLRKTYRFDLVFPDGFDFSSMERDFGWIRKESKDFGQGVIFSIMPYTSQSQFELANIIETRNRMCRRVPGPAEGSYMRTETSEPEYTPFCRPVNLNGFYAVETRGLWRLEGDFMGGPFVNYLIADTANARLIMLDAYLYSPRKPKRDLLMQLEGIARSFTTVKPADTIN
ncbi:MAG: DUF4837 family protein [Bacteroides sp.]|nr:DUF4837 family protein [Bacteroides sp.]MCM1084971.1 DUF4837 family protein [Bacteroides sp.]